MECNDLLDFQEKVQKLFLSEVRFDIDGRPEIRDEWVRPIAP